MLELLKALGNKNENGFMKGTKACFIYKVSKREKERYPGL